MKLPRSRAEHGRRVRRLSLASRLTGVRRRIAESEFHRALAGEQAARAALEQLLGRRRAVEEAAAAVRSDVEGREAEIPWRLLAAAHCFATRCIEFDSQLEAAARARTEAVRSASAQRIACSAVRRAVRAQLADLGSETRRLERFTREAVELIEADDAPRAGRSRAPDGRDGMPLTDPETDSERPPL